MLCHESQSTKGSLFLKIPPYSEKKNRESWRKALLLGVMRDRVVDASFRKQIEEGSVFIWERHFMPEEMEIHKFQTLLYLFLYQNNLFGSFEAEIYEVVD